MTSQPPRRLALLGLLALVPEIGYFLTQEEGFAPILAFICIALIIGSLVVMLTPDEKTTATPY